MQYGLLLSYAIWQAMQFGTLPVILSIYPLYLKNCNQDNVKNFFSRMRHGEGNRDNPSVFEFMSEYRKVSIESIFAKVRGSNCSTDAGDFLIKLNQFQSLVHVPTNKCTLLTLY